MSKRDADDTDGDEESAASSCGELLSYSFIISDTEITNRAVMSLPRQLQLKKSRVINDTGVWSAAALGSHTRFGPVVGKKLQAVDIKDTSSPYIWKVFDDGAIGSGLDLTDENQCNWMRYVRRARYHSERNVEAFQLDSQIYFITLQFIRVGEELLYWYSKEYCALVGATERPEDCYKCSQCDGQFANVDALEKHVIYKHSECTGRKFKCHLCTRTFISSSKMSVHVMSHLQVKPHHCLHCGRKFSDPSNLRKHIQVHTSEKMFTCPSCKKSFRQKAHLKSHQLTHSAEKHLKCDYCEKRFQRQSDLKQHRYKHTKEKQYLCGHCGKVFFKSQHLQKHTLSHEGKRSFSCQKCSKGFYTKYNMIRHTTTCTGKLDQTRTTTSSAPVKDKKTTKNQTSWPLSMTLRNRVAPSGNSGDKIGSSPKKLDPSGGGALSDVPVVKQATTGDTDVECTPADSIPTPQQPLPAVGDSLKVAGQGLVLDPAPVQQIVQPQHVFLDNMAATVPSQTYPLKIYSTQNVCNLSQYIDGAGTAVGNLLVALQPSDESAGQTNLGLGPGVDEIQMLQTADGTTNLQLLTVPQSNPPNSASNLNQPRTNPVSVNIPNLIQILSANNTNVNVNSVNRFVAGLQAQHAPPWPGLEGERGCHQTIPVPQTIGQAPIGNPPITVLSQNGSATGHIIQVSAQGSTPVLVNSTNTFPGVATNNQMSGNVVVTMTTPGDQSECGMLPGIQQFIDGGFSVTGNGATIQAPALRGLSVQAPSHDLPSAGHVTAPAPPQVERLRTIDVKQVSRILGLDVIGQCEENDTLKTTWPPQVLDNQQISLQIVPNAGTASVSGNATLMLPFEQLAGGNHHHGNNFIEQKSANTLISTANPTCSQPELSTTLYNVGVLLSQPKLL